jgi:LuxR family maltose regulon positive regulatory protein
VPTSLITTKLYIPPPQPNLVQRPHLNKKLKDGETRKLTLISAPAGFGKTTTVAEWIQKNNQHAAWISLDDGDNVLSRFMTYLITAIQRIDSDFGADILTVVQATEHPHLESLLTMFVNQIAEIQNEFILVLDDYHLISTQSIHDAVEFLLGHLPQNMHLVMIGRVDPPFSLSRLRVGGQLTELRSNDLRFTKGEITEFLNKIMGFDLTDGDIRALEIRTEGWVASLQLAALSLQNREDKREFIAAFSGSHHYIIDYLIDEVMSGQADEIQKFLCQTSILERFCASLSDEVLAITNSKNIIQQLEDANLFLIPLDDERHWFRYHHLFSDFLSQHLSEREPENVLPLHRSASHWFEQNNLFPEAINHALVGEDFEQAAQMVESIGPDMMMQSEFDQLTIWLDAMPPDLVNTWPWLCIIRAWMCQRWARVDEGERYLQAAEQALSNGSTPEPMGGEKVIRGQVAAIRALFALVRAQIPQSMEYANQALEYLPQDHFNRAVAADALGIAKRAIGEFDEAIKIFKKARKDSLEVGNRILAQAIMLELGRVQTLQGHLAQAAETFREAIHLEYQKTQIKIPYASSAIVYLADFLREWDDLEAAIAHLDEGIRIGQPAKMVDAVISSYALLTRVYLSLGDMGEAIKSYQTAERMARDTPGLESETKAILIESKVWLLLSQNKNLEAARFMDECGLDVTDEITFFNGFGHKTLARVLISSSRENPKEKYLSDAHSLITQMLDIAKPVGCMREVIELLVLQALAYQEQGLHDRALGSLEEALTLAEPEGYARTFIDEGEPMKTILKQAASRGIAEDYVNKLLVAFAPLEVRMESGATQPLLDPLSERELEVLRMLITELTGPEIARELMVSLNTLRTHTKNIYTKLDVNNRRAAVYRAQELKLL